MYVYILLFDCPTSYSQLWALLKGAASPTMLITSLYLFRPEVHREPRDEVGSLSTAKCLAGFEPRTFQF